MKMKTKKRLHGKKDPLKAAKQQLVSRIGQIKTMKDLETIKKCLSMEPLVKDDFEWDFGFLLDWMIFKMKRMSQYFHTHNIVEDENEYGNQIDKAIELLKIAYEKDDLSLCKDSEWPTNIKVNKANARRFVSKHIDDKTFKAIYLNENEMSWSKSHVRCAKAKELAFKYIARHIEYWWD